MTTLKAVSVLAKGALVLALGATANAAFAQVCGEFRNAYGPFDYRKTTPEMRKVVEDYHFTPEVQSLTAGASGAFVGSDLDYLLRVFPNHTRGLLAMTRLSEKEGEKPKGSRYTVECWFDRAVRYAPDDGAVRAIYGVYLLKKGRKDDAIKELEVARDLSSADDANLHYNLGLAYLEAGQPDKALTHAHRAYALGFPLPGLKNRLVRANKWREPGAPVDGKGG